MRLFGSRVYAIIYILLLAIAILLRVTSLDSTIYHYDNAFPTAQAIHFLDGGDLTLLGSPSDSFLRHHPAGLSYLVLPVWALTHSALAVGLFIALLNTLAVVFTFMLARGLPMMTPFGLMAVTGLMAVSPYLVEYSRVTWTSALIPALVTLAAWRLIPAWIRGSGRASFRAALTGWLALAALAAMTQLALIPIGCAALLSLLYWKQTNWRATLLGGALILLILGVFMLELRTAAASSAPNIAAISFGGGDVVNTLSVFSGLGYNPEVVINLPHTFTSASSPNMASLLVILITAAGLARVVMHRPLHRAGVVIGLWYLIQSAVLIAFAPNAHIYYFLLLLPAGPIFFAWGMSWLRGRLLILCCAVALSVGGIFFIQQHLRHIAVLRSWPAQYDLWQISMRDAMALGEQLAPLVTDDTVLQAEMFGPAMKVAIKRDLRVIWDIIDPNVTIIPAGATLLHVQALGAGEPPKILQGSTELARFTLPGETLILVSSIEPARALLAGLQPVNSQSEEGVILLGADISPLENGDFRVTLAWQIDRMDARTEQGVYDSFLHGFDDAGTRVQIIGGAQLESRWWAAGDIHLHTIIFTPAADLAALYAGQYDAGRGLPLRFADGRDAVLIWQK